MAAKVLLDLKENEQIVYEIRRHPAGLIPIIAVGIIVAIAMVVLMIALTLGQNELTAFIPLPLIYGVLSAVIVLAAIITFIVVGVYNANVLVITNENLIQVRQFSLFSRQTSQLNLANIHDVSADQEGILAYTFGFGTLTVETAGEAANFIFKTAKDPNTAARMIIEAHEQYIKTNANTLGSAFK